MMIHTEELKKVQKKIQGYAFGLKRKATKSEIILKKELERRGIKHKFQTFFHDSKVGFIVDFLLRKENTCPLVVEIDGDSHDSEKAKKYDEWRSEWLKEKRNCRIVRFRNEEVIKDVNAVVDEIQQIQDNHHKKREFIIKRI